MKATLRRYTSVNVLLDLLVNQRIFLVDPALWDDPNDARMISSYKDRADLEFLGAACLTGAQQKFHHWKLFAPGLSGVCIEFRTDELLRYTLPIDGIRVSEVQYLTVQDIRNVADFPISGMPFYKRSAFSAEEEVRIIYESKVKLDIYYLKIDMSCIRRIVTSPNMPEELHNSLKSSIHFIPDCASLAIDRSRLFDSKTWRKRWATRTGESL